MKTATIRVRNMPLGLCNVRTRFLCAWNSGEESGQVFDFESPVALFSKMLPRRWKLIECLQRNGPLVIAALARELGRNVEVVQEDAEALLEVGLIKLDEASRRWSCPFTEIHANFVIKGA